MVLELSVFLHKQENTCPHEIHQHGIRIKLHLLSSSFLCYDAGLLIIAVFVSIGLRGFNFSAGGWKTNFDRIGSYYCFRNIGWAFQYAMPIIFAMVVLKIVAPDLNPAFGKIGRASCRERVYLCV